MSDQSAITTTSNKSVYSSIQSFESAQRIAASLADSALVPNQYRGQQGLPNCIVAIEIANRMGMSPFQVMQNLNVIHGRPSWSSQFIIGLIQGCGRFEGFTYTETADSCQCFAALKLPASRSLAPRSPWTWPRGRVGPRTRSGPRCHRRCCVIALHRPLAVSTFLT